MAAPTKSAQANIRKGLQKGVLQEADKEVLDKLSKRSRYAYKAFMERPVWATISVLRDEHGEAWAFGPSLAFKLSENEKTVMKLISGHVRTVWTTREEKHSEGELWPLSQAMPSQGVRVTLDKPPHNDTCAYRAIRGLDKAFIGEVLFPVAQFIGTVMREEEDVKLVYFDRDAVEKLYDIAVDVSPVLMAFDKDDKPIAITTPMGTPKARCTMENEDAEA